MLNEKPSTNEKMVEAALNDRVISNFLKDDRNFMALVKAIYFPNPTNKQLVNDLFYKHKIEGSFVAYINKMLWRYSKDYYNKLNNRNTTHSYVLDQPIQDEGSNRVDMIPDENAFIEQSIIDCKLLETVQNPNLYYELLNLSDKQRFVIYLHIIKQYKFTEIGNQLGVTQQSVSKTFHKSISRLRNSVQ